MKKMLERTEKDLDFMELQGLYSRVQKKVKEKVTQCYELMPPDFDVVEKVAELYPKHSVTNKAEDGTNLQEFKEAIQQVTILSCKHNIRKKGEGASVTVKWIGYNLHGEKFELKLTEIADKDPSCISTIRNIACSAYTVNQLQHNTTYSITVSVQDKPESQSECTIVQTLPGVQCDSFLFSSILKSQDTRIDLKHKCLTSAFDIPENSNGLAKARGMAAGTITLLNESLYWEVDISFNLRGVENNCYVACVGICADEKLDAIANMVKNYFFYGLIYGKDNDGHPVLLTFVEGGACEKFPMNEERNYKKRIGFFYNANQPHLVIIDAQKNSVLLKTNQLKLIRRCKCMYCPVFVVNDGDGDPYIEIVTGSDISNVPSCLQEFLA